MLFSRGHGMLRFVTDVEVVCVTACQWPCVSQLITVYSNLGRVCHCIVAFCVSALYNNCKALHYGVNYSVTVIVVPIA